MMIYYRMFCHFVQRILGKIQELSSLPFQGGKGDSMRRAAADIVHMMEELLYFCLSGCVREYPKKAVWWENDDKPSNLRA